MLACAESNFLNFKFEYLRKNEFLRKTILACLSGDQMGSINEKNRGQKSRDTAPLKGQCHKQCCGSKYIEFGSVSRILGLIWIRIWIQEAPEYGSNTDPDPQHC